MKNVQIRETKTGKYQICVEGEAPGSVMDWNIFENLPDAEIALERTKKRIVEQGRQDKINAKIYAEQDRLEKLCSTPVRVSRQLRLQRALHDAYQGVCISGKRAASYERYHGGNDRYLGQICTANEEAEGAEQIYQRAADAHHLAAVARRNGDGAGWDKALDILESELRKFDGLNIYGIAQLDLEVSHA